MVVRRRDQRGSDTGNLDHSFYRLGFFPVVSVVRAEGPAEPCLHQCGDLWSGRAFYHDGPGAICATADARQHHRWPVVDAMGRQPPDN